MSNIQRLATEGNKNHKLFVDAINTLKCSQGFYGRLLRDIYELKKYEPEMFAMFVDEIESQNFRTALDVVMYFEG